MQNTDSLFTNEMRGGDILIKVIVVQFDYSGIHFLH